MVLAWLKALWPWPKKALAKTQKELEMEALAKLPIPRQHTIEEKQLFVLRDLLTSNKYQLYYAQQSFEQLRSLTKRVEDMERELKRK